jgi:very-short-patch-repair endonuclease
VKRVKIRRPRSFFQKKEYVSRQAKKMKRKMTWPEKEFAKLMYELGIKCESQKIVGLKIYDFYLEDYNMLIEVDGDYFHCNPEVFEEANKMQIRNQKNDKFKDVLAKGLGYLIERVWENDLKNNYEETKIRFKKLLKQ